MSRGWVSELLALRGTRWYRWHPQIALRYLPVVEWIRRLERSAGRRLSVAEIGPGGLGIVPYLRRPVVGVDVTFEPPIHPLLLPVIADATALPLQDDSVEMVVSVDMLEHLTSAKRGSAIAQMLRVARRWVVIGVPCGKKAAAQDLAMRELYRRRFGEEFPFLEEQVEHGLPTRAIIVSSIKQAARWYKKRVVISVGGNMNISLRRFLMKGWMSRNLLVNVLFRKLFSLLIPLFRRFDRPPYYRKIFFVEIERSQFLD